VSSTLENVQSLVRLLEVRVSDHGYEEVKVKKLHRTKLIHEGQYIAEVDVELIETEDEWSPCLSVEDAYKMDDVRELLIQGNIKSASQLSKVYTMIPVAM
jgi:hypothetical protein